MSNSQPVTDGSDGTPTTIVDRFRTAAKPKKNVQWLISKLDDFIKGLYLKDLFRDEIITRTDIRKPTTEVIERLLKASTKAIKHHRLYPHAAKHKNSNATTRAEWAELAETSLFRSKRSKQLAMMLSIRRLFSDGTILILRCRPHLGNNSSIQPRFRQAVGQIVRLVKAERLGINMMDIATAEAVAPYNVILGGKLVSLLLCSPEIIRAYQARYEKQTSLIASCMRGASVKRTPQLVLLCTTSLYGSALNQYSRLKTPVAFVGGKLNEKIEYDCLGTSEGFGSFQFSKDSLRMMSMLLRALERGAKSKLNLW